MLTLTSPAFEAGQAMPEACTCEGANAAPPLAWSGAPPGTQSFVLIVDDPDAPDPAAPKMTFVHWVVFNLPAECRGLDGDLPAGAAEGLNDRHQVGWTGPCPPIGRHRYFHKLYALDTRLPDVRDATKPQIEPLMKGHIVAEAELVGTYQKRAVKP